MRIFYSLLVVTSMTSSAFAQRKAAPDACVHRARNESSRFLREVKLDASALTFCTGNDCWSYDLKDQVTSIPTARPIAADASPGELPKSDPRGTATKTQVTFCPTGPSACKKFDYKFAFEPANAVRTVVNQAGTLGAIVYLGVPEANQPSYVIAYDLAKGTQIAKLVGGDVLLFRASFAVDGKLYSPTGKKLGKLAVSDHGAPNAAIAGGDLVAMADLTKGVVVIQDTAKGKAKPPIKLGLKDLSAAQLVSSADGATAYLVLDHPYEGEIMVIDVAGNKLASRKAPAVCAPDAWRK